MKTSEQLTAATQKVLELERKKQQLHAGQNDNQ